MIIFNASKSSIPLRHDCVQLTDYGHEQSVRGGLCDEVHEVGQVTQKAVGVGYDVPGTNLQLHTTALASPLKQNNNLVKCSRLLARPHFYRIAWNSHCTLVAALSKKSKYHSVWL